MAAEDSELEGEDLSEPRRHHYVPVFYLSAWCGVDNRLQGYRKDTTEVKSLRVSPKDTAVERDLYAFQAGKAAAQELLSHCCKGPCEEGFTLCLLYADTSR